MSKERPKIIHFEVIHFPEGERQVILIYGLGDDGILYELAGGRWAAFPIKPDFMRDPFPKLDDKPPVSS